MNKDRIEGAAKTAGGRIQEAAGKAVGDQKMVVEGKMKKMEGKIQNAVGGMEDAAEKADKEDRKH
ncbi:MAG: CsbD family protein [Rhodospirillaceae bacterium]